MKYLFMTILVLIILLSMAAGGAKIMNMPQEIQLFTEAGLHPGWLVPFGLLQLLAGLAAIFGRTRLIGATLMALGFLVSSLIIFATGNMGFGIFSLVPVLLSLVILWRSRLEA